MAKSKVTTGQDYCPAMLQLQAKHPTLTCTIPDDPITIFEGYTHAKANLRQAHQDAQALWGTFLQE